MEKKGEVRGEETRASCRLLRPAVGSKRRTNPYLECLSADIHVHRDATDANQITKRCS
jgi:hypothetical protein